MERTRLGQRFAMDCMGPDREVVAWRGEWPAWQGEAMRFRWRHPGLIVRALVFVSRDTLKATGEDRRRLVDLIVTKAERQREHALARRRAGEVD